MKLSVIGTGYVGLVAGTCFAESGNQVICVDIDSERLAALKRGRVPFYEPGLEELVRRNLSEGRLRFTTDISSAVRQSEIIFIAVGTPQKEDGSADLSHVLAAARQIGRSINGYKIIVCKSTVPVGSLRTIAEVVRAQSKHRVDFASNPEFMKEGAAVDDFMRPDRVVIGTESERAARVLSELYAPFTRTGAPILVLSPESAEMAKYASNAMLAARISLMNELANLCELVGADIESVRRVLGTDRRIGPAFLFAGVGYGGSCLPKDVRAIMAMGRKHSCEMPMLEAVDTVNRSQRRRFLEKVLKYFDGRLNGLKFAIWGLSFKPRTSDMREAPSISIIEGLLAAGARVRAHDPEANGAARCIFGRRISYARSSYEALVGADALIIITEWNQFREPDLERMRQLLRRPVIFDGRNLFDPAKMRSLGFEYFSIGRAAAKMEVAAK